MYRPGTAGVAVFEIWMFGAPPETIVKACGRVMTLLSAFVTTTSRGAVAAPWRLKVAVKYKAPGPMLTGAATISGPPPDSFTATPAWSPLPKIVAVKLPAFPPEVGAICSTRKVPPSGNLVTNASAPVQPKPLQTG